MSVTDVEAIDVHAHYGLYKVGGSGIAEEFKSAGAETVVARARLAGTGVSVVSPLLGLLPRGKNDAFAGNEEAARIVAATEGLLQWVVVDPLKPETYGQAAEMLKLPKCVGIKIHPEEHCYRISEHGRRIFEFAAERGAVVMTHSGHENSMPEDFVPLANDYPEVRLILAHLGCGWDGDLGHQVRAIQSCRHENTFVDTSSAASITSGLVEWAADEIGAGRILYGTDSPLYFAAMQRARINHAEIADEEKHLILHDNAAGLLGLASNG